MTVMKSCPLDLPPYSGEIAEEYATPEVLALFAGPHKLLAGPGAEILLEGRNRVGAVKIAAGRAGTTEIVVKEYLSYGINKLKSRVQPSKAAKAWRGARVLLDAGFDTPFPIAFLEKRKGGFVDEGYFIAERIFAAGEIRHLLRQLSEEDLRPLLAELARTLFRLHEKGILHRDLSDGNVLVGKEAGGSHFFFLDTNRIRRRRSLGAAARAKNLIRLGVPPLLQRFFLEEYAAAGNHPLRRSFVFWYKLSKNTFTAWVRLKKVLRLKRLGRKLRIQ